MNVLRITNGFQRLSDGDLEKRAGGILSDMTGNAFFPTPVPTLAEFQTAIDTYSAALAAAQGGSTYEKAVKNQKKAELVELLHNLSNYVLFTAAGDEMAIKSSGFTISKGPSPSVELTPAKGLLLEDGANAGELRLSFDRVAGAKSYVYQCTPDPVSDESTWQNQVGTISKAVFTGLDSGKRHWCRVMAIGSGGQGVYSDPISRIVQ